MLQSTAPSAQDTDEAEPTYADLLGIDGRAEYPARGLEGPGIDRPRMAFRDVAERDYPMASFGVGSKDFLDPPSPVPLDFPRGGT
jgi:hypothetical protein